MASPTTANIPTAAKAIRIKAWPRSAKGFIFIYNSPSKQ
jgi:hypothetical protein